MRLTDDEGTENRLGKVAAVSKPPLFGTQTITELERLLTEERQNNEQLNRVIRSDKESLRRMEAMLAMATHDLKNPLAAILLNVQSILHAAQGLPPSLRARLQRIQQLVRQSTQLVTDVLTVEREEMNGAPLSLEPIDLGALVRQTVALFAEQLEASGGAIFVSAPSDIQGCWDRTALTQIVSNLVSNAIKYGDGKPFQIALNRSGDRVWIVVADRGAGLRTADSERIFRPFQQLRATDAWEGSGLGLWIVTKAAERLGGTVRLHNTADGGATFVVELPLCAGGPAADSRAPASAPR